MNAGSRATKVDGSDSRSGPRSGSRSKSPETGRNRSRPTPAIFYGYSVELIQAWCGVSRPTAYLYKIGARKPSKLARRLFVLHRDGRVLGPEWRDWAVHKNKLVSPEGQETTQSQLSAYWLVMQLARELTKDDPAARKEFYRILATG